MAEPNRPVTVLIVEDDDMRDLLVDLVEAEGHCAIAAASAEAALALGAEAAIALIEHILPSASGRAFSQILRDRSKAGIIMVTTAASPMDRVQYLEWVADDHVLKPSEPAELCARIQAVLRRLDRSPRPTAVEPSSRRAGTAGRFRLPPRLVVHRPQGPVGSLPGRPA